MGKISLQGFSGWLFAFQLSSARAVFSRWHWFAIHMCRIAGWTRAVCKLVRGRCRLGENIFYSGGRSGLTSAPKICVELCYWIPVFKGCSPDGEKLLFCGQI